MLAVITGRTEWRSDLQCKAVNSFSGDFYEVCCCAVTLYLLSSRWASVVARPLIQPPILQPLSQVYKQSTKFRGPYLKFACNYHVIILSSFQMAGMAWTLFYKVEQLCSGSDRSVFMWQKCLSKPYPCEFIDRGCWGFIANKRWLMTSRWEVKLLISVKNLSGVGWRRDVGRVTSCAKVRKGLLIECTGEGGGVGALIKLRGQTLRPRCHLTPWLRDCRVAVSATAPSDVFVW